MSTQQVALDTDKLFIGGEWVPSLGAGASSHLRQHRGARRFGPRRHRGRHRRGGRRGASAFDDPQRLVVLDGRGSRARRSSGSPTRSRRAARRPPAASRCRTACRSRIALQLEAVVPRRASRATTPGSIRQCELDEERAGPARRHDPRRAQAGRRRRARSCRGTIPQTLAMFKLAPALAMGCTVVMKPQPGDGARLAAPRRGRRRGGLPAGVLNIVPGGPRGRRLPRRASGRRQGRVHRLDRRGPHDRARSAGACCARCRSSSAASQRRSCSTTPTSRDAGEALFGATLLNNGQTCYLGTRVLAPRSRYDEVVDDVRRHRQRRCRSATRSTRRRMIGPMASLAPSRRVEGYIAHRPRRGRPAGHRRRPARTGRGWFVEPTVFADVSNDQTIAREEIFGPVLAIIPYDGEEDAIRIANDSEYGLGGTRVDDRRRSRRRRRAARSDRHHRHQPATCSIPPRPSAASRARGLGRELGPEGLVAYQQLQSIYLPAGAAG